MIVPGLVFTGGRVLVQRGFGIVPDFINQGFGFMNSGALALDLDAPSGNFYTKGWRMSAAGAMYAADTPDNSNYTEGVFQNSDGRILYELADTSVYVNRNPVTVNDRLAVTE